MAGIQGRNGIRFVMTVGDGSTRGKSRRIGRLNNGFVEIRLLARSARPREHRSTPRENRWKYVVLIIVSAGEKDGVYKTGLADDARSILLDCQ